MYCFRRISYLEIQKLQISANELNGENWRSLRNLKSDLRKNPDALSAKVNAEDFMTDTSRKNSCSSINSKIQTIEKEKNNSNLKSKEKKSPMHLSKSIFDFGLNLETDHLNKEIKKDNFETSYGLFIQEKYFRKSIYLMEEKQIAESIKYISDVKMNRSKKYFFEILFEDCITQRSAIIDEETFNKLNKHRDKSMVGVGFFIKGK